MPRCVNKTEVGRACEFGRGRWVGGRQEAKRRGEKTGEGVSKGAEWNAEMKRNGGKWCEGKIKDLVIRNTIDPCECAGGARGFEDDTRALLELHCG